MNILGGRQKLPLGETRTVAGGEERALRSRLLLLLSFSFFLLFVLYTIAHSEAARVEAWLMPSFWAVFRGAAGFMPVVLARRSERMQKSVTFLRRRCSFLWNAEGREKKKTPRGGKKESVRKDKMRGERRNVPT